MTLRCTQSASQAGGHTHCLTGHALLLCQCPGDDPFRASVLPFTPMETSPHHHHHTRGGLWSPDISRGPAPLGHTSLAPLTPTPPPYVTPLMPAPGPHGYTSSPVPLGTPAFSGTLGVGHASSTGHHSGGARPVSTMSGMWGPASAASLRTGGSAGTTPSPFSRGTSGALGATSGTGTAQQLHSPMRSGSASTWDTSSTTLNGAPTSSTASLQQPLSAPSRGALGSPRFAAAPSLEDMLRSQLDSLDIALKPAVQQAAAAAAAASAAASTQGPGVKGSAALTPAAAEARLRLAAAGVVPPPRTARSPSAGLTAAMVKGKWVPEQEEGEDGVQV
jgi:hypothetical protein